jgi:hypothetical protein
LTYRSKFLIINYKVQKRERVCLAFSRLTLFLFKYGMRKAYQPIQAYDKSI